jgi:hypothetical protein
VCVGPACHQLCCSFSSVVAVILTNIRRAKVEASRVIKIGWWNLVDPILKIIENTVHCLKILEKDKNYQNICKKLDQILRLLVNKFL